jgi:hypothetical protein
MAHKKAARWPYDPRVKRLLQTFLVMAKFEPATVRAILRTIEPRDVVARYDATVRCSLPTQATVGLQIGAVEAHAVRSLGVATTLQRRHLRGPDDAFDFRNGR